MSALSRSESNALRTLNANCERTKMTLADRFVYTAFVVEYVAAFIDRAHLSRTQMNKCHTGNNVLRYTYIDAISEWLMASFVTFL